MKTPLNIEEFALQTKIEGTGSDMHLVIECLGFLGSYIRPVVIPITWQDIDDNGEVKEEVMQFARYIAARLNASNAPLPPHPAESEPLYPITTEEAVAIDEAVEGDYLDYCRHCEEDEMEEESEPIMFPLRMKYRPSGCTSPTYGKREENYEHH